MKTKSSMEGSRQEVKGPTTPRKGKTKFKFDTPPEAPVFLPTPEEFENPLKYINKIRPIGQSTGICKIIPPKGWRAPFVLDKDELKFTPRIQRINELEARTRIKLNFIDQLTKFYALRGKTFQIPIIEKRTLDLYSLHKLVRERGGHENVTKNKLWPEIAQKLDLTNIKTPSLIRTHYDHIVLPFIIARSEAVRNMEGGESDGTLKQGSNSDKYAQSLRELKSLTFLGPGPKMAVCDLAFSKSIKTRTRGKKILYEFDPLAKYMCKSCSNGEIDEVLVTCVSCEDKYHSSCLIPPLVDVTATWKCPKCIATEVCKPLEDFGFAQAEREYSLNEFKEMANKFKSNYFKMDPREVPLSVVENEFWRVVSSIEESVTVEYGADLHVIDHGSGFPIKNKASAPGIDKEEFDKYAESEWNLNNLPVLKASVLRHISADISGMKIPWMYAGMCFATFCWHNEDHWSYSINYLHLGEPKTWYGVPGSSAEDFERAMKAEAPELFDSQPDILHHLVTIMNPNDIMKTGVPIYRTDQKEGEFVITFPRAYHAGFNQGFNFAEACNFAPYDWLHIGRECINHYSSVKRFCVFSHDELVCKMAELYDELDKRILLATYKDMRTMVNAEHSKRRFLLNKGIKNAVRVKFDELPDDERQCFICKTTCFLSALVCKCTPLKLVCLDHHEHLCKCPYKNKKLKYHYKIDELVAILYVIRNKVEYFDEWIVSVDKTVSNYNRKFYFRIFTELLLDSKDKEFTKSQLLDVLENQVKSCLKISSSARKFLKSVVDDSCKDDKRSTLPDLITFSKEMKNFPSSLVEAKSLNNLLTIIGFLQNSLTRLLKSKCPKKCRRTRILQCMRFCRTLNISIPEFHSLELKLKELKWVSKANKMLNKGGNIRFSIHFLKKLVEEAKALEESKLIERERIQVMKFFSAVEKWKSDVNWGINSLSSSTPLNLTKFEDMLKDGLKFDIIMPELKVLRTIIRKTKILNICIDDILKNKKVYCLNEINNLVLEASRHPVTFDNFLELKSQIKSTKTWLMSANKLFFKKSTKCELLPALWPRKFIPRIFFYKNQQDTSEHLLNLRDSQYMLKLKKKDFSEAFKIQLHSLYEIRVNNLKRKTNCQSCPCGNEVSGKFVECELCTTHYHAFCIKIDKTNVIDLYGLCKKYICKFCLRTKRPSYQNLKTLLVESRKLSIKTPEMAALEYNMAKINNWLVKAKNILSSEEVIRGLKYITENTNKILTESELLKEKSPPNNVDKNSPLWRGIFSLISENHNFKFIELSTQSHLELRSLMVKGDLFEVHLKENNDIWMLVQALKVQMYLASNFKGSTIETSPLKPPNSKTKFNIVKKNLTKPKRKPNIKRVLRKLNVSGGVSITSTKTGRVTLETSGLESSVQNPDEMELGEEHDMEEKCASEVCLRPTDDSLDWVQCDGRCGQWFHMRCVDLTKQELTEEDDFVCLQCMDRLGKNEEEEEVPLAHVASLVLPVILPPTADPLL